MMEGSIGVSDLRHPCLRNKLGGPQRELVIGGPKGVNDLRHPGLRRKPEGPQRELGLIHIYSWAIGHHPAAQMQLDFLSQEIKTRVQW